ncbi:hypothetical protein B0J11DRAFT_421599 [Dendryphion nanum]|uniref:Peptidase C14 caspase domain-containing protein n=1 Tax=Dendryphion nanum TaxID=256645 RepID=A0A9P9IYC7_9PLEO|nr:hypothetical protein B0J11DRAFT_421599 [Dendryphion nanum]
MVPVNEGLNREEKARQQLAIDMQTHWDEGVEKNLKLSSGYEQVAVLIIKWEKSLDDLNTEPEATELGDLFRNDFRYHVETADINDSSKPQHQLSEHLSKFIRCYDGQHNLLIIYYSGHGVYIEHEKYLQLSGRKDDTEEQSFNIHTKANWNKVEDILHADDVEGDVLSIMDTCYASNFSRAAEEDVRAFELLSACGLNETTSRPGPYSFTRALIDALKRLRVKYQDKPFTTHELNQTINRDPRRIGTSSQLWHRRKHHERHIRLGPVKKQQKGNSPPQPKSYLTLRFAINQEILDKDRIFDLTGHLSEALSHMDSTRVQRIDWISLKPARVVNWGRSYRAVASMTRWSIKKKPREDIDQPKDDNEDNSHADMGVDGAFTTTSSPKRKRSQEEPDFSPISKKPSLPLQWESYQ